MRQFGQWGVVGLAAMVIVALATTAFASEPTAPEVSPTSISTGFALVSGSILMVRAWRRR